MTLVSSNILERAGVLLRAAADPAKAAPMAAYMKSDVPFHGVPAPERRTICRQLVTEFPAGDRRTYEFHVGLLWKGAFREERYLAVRYARAFERYRTMSSIRLYRSMITQGAWWDYVDEIAVHLIGGVLADQRDRAGPSIEAWSISPDMWLRRTSILAQLNHKASTDVEMLDHVCTVNLADDEFFIRKAIGWALREYAKTDPAWVQSYVDEHTQTMSGLTTREAMKHLAR